MDFTLKALLISATVFGLSGVAALLWGCPYATPLLWGALGLLGVMFLLMLFDGATARPEPSAPEDCAKLFDPHTIPPDFCVNSGPLISLPNPQPPVIHTHTTVEALPPFVFAYTIDEITYRYEAPTLEGLKLLRQYLADHPIVKRTKGS